MPPLLHRGARPARTGRSPSTATWRRYHFASLHRDDGVRDQPLEHDGLRHLGPAPAQLRRPCGPSREAVDAAAGPAGTPASCVGAIYWLFPGLAIAGGWRQKIAVSLVLPGGHRDSSLTQQIILLRARRRSTTRSARPPTTPGDWFHDVVLDEDYATGYGVQQGPGGPVRRPTSSSGATSPASSTSTAPFTEHLVSSGEGTTTSRTSRSSRDRSTVATGRLDGRVAVITGQHAQHRPRHRRGLPRRRRHGRRQRPVGGQGQAGPRGDGRRGPGRLPSLRRRRARTRSRSSSTSPPSASAGSTSWSTTPAAASGFAPIHQLTDEAWQQRAGPGTSTPTSGAPAGRCRTMLAGGWGRIINISSVEGKQANKPMISHYITNKHAINGLTKATAFEYGTQGITCNAICPGAVETDLMRDVGPLVARSRPGITYEEFLDGLRRASRRPSGSTPSRRSPPVAVAARERRRRRHHRRADQRRRRHRAVVAGWRDAHRQRRSA